MLLLIMSHDGEKHSVKPLLFNHEYQNQRLTIEVKRSDGYPPSVSIFSDRPLIDIYEFLTQKLPEFTSELDSTQYALFLMKYYAKLNLCDNVWFPDRPKHLLYIVSQMEQEQEPFNQNVIRPLIKFGMLPPEIIG